MSGECVRVAVVTIEGANANLQRDLQAADLVYLTECGVWVDVVATTTVTRKTSCSTWVVTWAPTWWLPTSRATPPASAVAPPILPDGGGSGWLRDLAARAVSTE